MQLNHRVTRLEGHRRVHAAEDDRAGQQEQFLERLDADYVLGVTPDLRLVTAEDTDAETWAGIARTQAWGRREQPPPLPLPTRAPGPEPTREQLDAEFRDLRRTSAERAARVRAAVDAARRRVLEMTMPIDGCFLNPSSFDWALANARAAGTV